MCQCVGEAEREQVRELGWGMVLVRPIAEGRERGRERAVTGQKEREGEK